MTIRAAIMPAPHAPIEMRDLPEPEIEPGGVLLETIASEVCGTDVHLWHGRLSGVPYPIIPGHVSVGRVIESRGVDRDALGEPLKIGDVVTFYDVHETCHACYHCTIAEQPNRCPSRKVYGITYSLNDGLLGGWCERIYMKPGVRILKLPANVSADSLIGGGCGLFTGFACVDRSDMRMGDTVIVQGAGPVGLSAAAFARIRGAEKVIVIGAPDSRLKLATDLGADFTISIDATSLEDRSQHIREMTNSRGGDVVIECSGNPRAIPEGLSLLRDGGTYVIGGHYTDAGPVEINPHLDINRKHADIRGQWGTAYRHVVRGLRMLAKHAGSLPLERIIGRKYGLADAQQALDDVAALRVTKAIIDPSIG